LIEMYFAMIKRSIKDLGHSKYVIRFGAEEFFASDTFECVCKRNAFPYDLWLEKIKQIIKERGIRKKKLIIELSKEVKDYL